MAESLRDRRKRRTAEAILAGALELFEARGFERTTIGQRDVEDLVSSEHAAGQFNIELVSLAYVSMQ